MLVFFWPFQPLINVSTVLSSMVCSLMTPTWPHATKWPPLDPMLDTAGLCARDDIANLIHRERLSLILQESAETLRTQELNGPEVPQLAQLVKNPPAHAGDMEGGGSVPVSGRSPGEGNGNPPRYSCLGNPMDRGAWWAITVHGVTNSWT